MSILYRLDDEALLASGHLNPSSENGIWEILDSLTFGKATEHDWVTYDWAKREGRVREFFNMIPGEKQSFATLQYICLQDTLARVIWWRWLELSTNEQKNQRFVDFVVRRVVNRHATWAGPTARDDQTWYERLAQYGLTDAARAWVMGPEWYQGRRTCSFRQLVEVWIRTWYGLLNRMKNASWKRCRDIRARMPVPGPCLQPP
jgi:hypothetical protein